MIYYYYFYNNIIIKWGRNKRFIYEEIKVMIGDEPIHGYKISSPIFHKKLWEVGGNKTRKAGFNDKSGGVLSKGTPAHRYSRSYPKGGKDAAPDRGPHKAGYKGGGGRRVAPMFPPLHPVG